MALLLAIATVTTAARAAGYTEYDLKAACLYKLLNYIDWPDQSAGTIIIGVVGENPFGPALAQLNGRMAKGRAISVREVSAGDLRGCHVVFISPSEKQRLGPILDSLKTSRILTISEMDGFAERGGIINFVSERNKVRFEINPDAARSKGLTISSELLSLARVVKS